MSFVTPWFMFLMAAGAAPLIIHLLTRDRVRRVAFSSLRFFANASRTVLRRKRFAEMVLIAMRVLACVLLAVVFARPLFSGDDAEHAGAASEAVVIVVDTSASMARVTDDQALRDRVLDAIGDVSRSGEAALVTFGRTPVVSAPMSRDHNELRVAAESLKIGHGGTDIVGALDKARQLLAASEARARRVVLISDTQRVGWQSFNGAWRLPPGTELSVQSISADEAAANLAIVDAQTPQSLVLDRQLRHVTVRVANYSAAAQPDVDVSLRIKDSVVDTQRVQIPAGQTVDVRFSHTFDEPGDHPGIVRINVDDAAPDDNVLYFNARVIGRIPIVVLAGGAVGQFDPVSFFAAAALQPSDRSPFAVRTIPAAAARPDDIAQASVVVVADVNMINDSLKQALSQLLNRGGGLLFLPGTRTQPDLFDDIYGSLAPCNLRRVITQSQRQSATGLTRIDYTHPVFSLFLQPHHGDFTSINVHRYWEVSDSQLSTVLARFDDGRPAIVEQQIGNGLSMIWLTPVDPEWNNVPLRAIYLPLMHQCVRRLTLRTERQTAYTVGDVLPVDDDASIRNPDDQPIDDPSVIAATPGFHTMTTGEGEPFVYAVNVPLSEASIETVNEQEIIAALEQPEQPGAQAGQSLASLAGDKLEDRGMWRVVLVVLLVLLVGELYLGNRTARH